MSWVWCLALLLCPRPAGAEASNVVSVVFSSSASLPRLAPELVRLGVERVEPAFDFLPAAPAHGAIPDLARFTHLVFRDAAAAAAALPALEASGRFESVEPLFSGDLLASDPFPDDPYFLSWPWGWPSDPQWCLRNQGTRGTGTHCGPARAGADVGIDETWRQIEDGIQRMGHAFALDPWIGAPEVVLGFLDVGMLDAHPDLRVFDGAAHDPRISLCPNADWCGDHATKMAGLSAARTGNGMGIAGVAGECTLLDLVVPACGCDKCDQPSENCLFVSALWHTKLVSALDVDLGVTNDQRPRVLRVMNASFATAGYAPEEVVEALWAAHQRGVLFVAASGDQSFAAPSPRYPANVPFVLGVGGSTWEDRFWDATASCYSGSNGTTLGPEQIDLTAPASGPVVTAFPYENPIGAGLYAPTTGQCSAAAALVTGVAGVVQAVVQRRTGSPLAPDDLAGVLMASARPYRSDPTLGGTCPPELCPRGFYGRGVVDLENALLVLNHADHWTHLILDSRSVDRGEAESWEVEFVPPEFVWNGETWREYRVRATLTLPSRPMLPSAPPDLSRTIAWAEPAAATAPLAYGSGANRVRPALAGITSCSLDLDPATGSAVVTASNFARVIAGNEVPLVDWDALQLPIVVWRDSGRLHDPLPVDRGPGGAGLAVRISPNPSRGPLTVEVRGLRADPAARLEIFDCAGRLVRRLVPRYSPAFEAVWDGRDQEARSAPPGIYFVRLTTRGLIVTRPVARVG